MERDNRDGTGKGMETHRPTAVPVDKEKVADIVNPKGGREEWRGAGRRFIPGKRHIFESSLRRDPWTRRET
jgi:hypothetical protein